MTWNNLVSEVKQSLFSTKRQKLQKRLHWDSNAQYAKQKEWTWSKDVKLLFSLTRHKRKTLKIKTDFTNERNQNLFLNNFINLTFFYHTLIAKTKLEIKLD